ncbi:helix-turn-helix transcriptional regulator [Brachybacterium sp. GCM10030268]|uniref:helix-turn-helix transcriptional regulator n=1 Tax=Brachybacterium sp. GCM10030268 TaxID=3273382 RepID=UPI00361864B2
MTAAIHSLGALIRTWRERLSPAAAGIASSGARRTAGLRREELALLAGVSVDYLTRLEQGRASAPSGQVVDSLARALQLDEDETAVLFRSANLLPPGGGRMDERVPPGIERMIERMADLPLAAFAADWTMLRSTPAWTALFAGVMEADAEPPNLAVATFLGRGGGPTPARHEDHEALEEALVADLRRSAAEYGEDPRFTTVVKRLRDGSERFRRLWDDGRATAHRSMRKRLVHDVIGQVDLDCDVLSVPGSDVKLIVYSAAPDSEDAEALARLSTTAGGAGAITPLVAAH